MVRQVSSRLALVAFSFGCLAGCVPEATPPPRAPPPAPLPEIVQSQPAPGMTWAPGCWYPEGEGYVWLPGHWESSGR